jgi:hypothetical protein
MAFLFTHRDDKFDAMEMIENDGCSRKVFLNPSHRSGMQKKYC